MLDYLIISQLAASNNQENFGFGLGYDLFTMIISFLIAFGAAYLAYQCNAKESTGMRLFITVIAFLFGTIYLIYYFIRYVLMGQKC